MVSNFPQTIQLGSAGAIDGDHNDEDKDSKTLTMAKAECDRELKRKVEEINKTLNDDDNEIIFYHGQRHQAIISREEIHLGNDLKA